MLHRLEINLSSWLCYRVLKMYGRVVLVAVGVLSTLTTAMDSLQTSVGELEAIRDNNRVAQCVSSPPNMSLSARSKIDCMRACISYGCSCAYGANYHTDSRVCQLHSDPPDSLEHLPNCVYYQVSLRFYTTRTTEISILSISFTKISLLATPAFCKM